MVQVFVLVVFKDEYPSIIPSAIPSAAAKKILKFAGNMKVIVCIGIQNHRSE